MQRRSASRVPTIAITVVLVVLLVAGAFAGGAAAERAGLFGSAEVAASAPAVAEFKVFWEAWDLVKRHYVNQSAVDNTALTYGAIRGMLDALGDEGHTRFLSPAELQAEEEALAGRFEGIGAHLTMRDGRPTILAPIPGSPAQQAGLRAGDIIVAVDGREVADLRVDEIARLVRGPAGTQVTVSVIHPGDTTISHITVTRAKIDVPNVSWTMVPGTNVAHLLLSQFAERATQDLVKALAETRERGATAVILDLRNNPGGLRDEAIGVASQFLTTGNVLIEVDAQGQRTEYPVRPGGAAPTIPLVVLVNEGTASSAEIAAGALQDHRRAKVVGVPTAGTGTVLSIFNLSDGSAIFLGTRAWLTPNGREIWHRGITPDVTVTMPPGALPVLPMEEERWTPEQLRDHQDAQLLRALVELNQPVPAPQP